MENTKNDIGYFPAVPICDKYIETELNSDFTLPDYKSEIRRLISSEVTLVPRSDYVGLGEAICEGELFCKLLYLGADGGFYCTTLGDKYSFKIPLEFDSHSVSNDDITLVCDYSCNAVAPRVLGPRKINLRIKLSAHALALSPALYSPSLTGAHNSANIENLVLNTQCATFKVCKSDVLLMSDLIALEGETDEIRIIDASAKVNVEECSAQHNCINVRGDVFLKVSLCDESKRETPQFITKKVPFNTSIECDGVNSEYDVRAWGVTYDEQANVSDGGIKTEFSLLIFVQAQKNEDVEYIADAFSTERHTKCKVESARFLRSARATNTCLSQNASFGFDEANIPAGAIIVDAIARPCVEETVIENGKLIIKGKTEYLLICLLEGEYATRELSSPVRCELDIRSAELDEASMRACISVSCLSTRARGDSERVFIDSELCFGILIDHYSMINYLSEMSFGEPREKSVGEMTLCYPEKNASLWDVAKYYGEREQKIRALNSIPDGDSTIKKKFLII